MLHAYYFYFCRGGNLNAFLTRTMGYFGQSVNFKKIQVELLGAVGLQWDKVRLPVGEFHTTCGCHSTSLEVHSESIVPCSSSPYTCIYMRAQFYFPAYGNLIL